jgi:hypothetical protein
MLRRRISGLYGVFVSSQKSRDELEGWGEVEIVSTLVNNIREAGDMVGVRHTVVNVLIETEAEFFGGGDQGHERVPGADTSG